MKQSTKTYRMQIPNGTIVSIFWLLKEIVAELLK